MPRTLDQRSGTALAPSGGELWPHSFPQLSQHLNSNLRENFKHNYSWLYTSIIVTTLSLQLFWLRFVLMNIYYKAIFQIHCQLQTFASK